MSKVTVYPYSEKRFPWQHPPVGPKLSFYLALRGIKWRRKKKKRREREKEEAAVQEAKKVLEY